MLRQSSFNYADQTPENLRDFLFINSTDQEEFAQTIIQLTYIKKIMIQSLEICYLLRTF